MRTVYSAQEIWKFVCKGLLFSVETSGLLKRQEPVAFMEQGSLLIVSFRVDDWKKLSGDRTVMNRFLRLLKNGYGVKRLGIQFPVRSASDVPSIQINTNRGWPRVIPEGHEAKTPVTLPEIQSGPMLTFEDLKKMLAELKEVRDRAGEEIEILANTEELVRCGARILPGNRILIQGHVFGFRTLKDENPIAVSTPAR